MNIRDLVLGFIIGDSFGLSLLNNEYSYDNIKLHNNTVLNIKGGNYSFLTINLLATMDSISLNKKIISNDIVDRLCMSLIVGKYTVDRKVYGMNNIIFNLLEKYSKKNVICEVDNNDISSIGRIIPIVIYNYYNEDTLDTLIPVLSVTNTNELVLVGEFILYKYILNILNGYSKFKSLKISIPDYFTESSKKVYKSILKGNIFYDEIVFDDNIVNILKIFFYVILNSDNMNDVFLMMSNFDGYNNIYSSIILSVAVLIYGFDDALLGMYKKLKNKRDINKIIKSYERMFYEKVY